MTPQDTAWVSAMNTYGSDIPSPRDAASQDAILHRLEDWAQLSHPDVIADRAALLAAYPED